MAVENQAELTVLKGVTVLLGATFLLYALKAYRRHRDRPLLVLIVAVVVMTFAEVAEGVAYKGLGSLDKAHVIEAVVMLLAFALLVPSLFVPHVKTAAVPAEDLEPVELPKR